MARKKLVVTRKELGLSQQQLANKVGIHRAYLSNVESGKHNPSLETAAKIARELNRTVEDLFL
ncbi:hypothetical protein LD39_11265 [Halobacillus sp. BBL2006]|nr:hypothetical protein LD39_11265 [Halobacillus sp. BBL2006]